jgi:polyvinyl alcohol dehydrogenase (cytochrome)
MRISLLLLLLAVSSAAGATPPAPDGSALYAVRCAACHEHASGRIPPRYVLNSLSPDQVSIVLTDGAMRQQTVGLTAAEINALVFYLTRKQAGGAGPDAKANLCGRPIGAIDLDRPGWNGWGRDLANSRFQPDPGLAASDVPRLKLKWAFAYPGSEAVGLPVVVGDKLFVSAVTGRVFALDTKTGCTYWSFDADGPVKTAVTIGPLGGAQPAQTAAFFGDMSGSVYAVDATTGQLIWKVKADDHPLAQIRGTPKLYHGRLYVPVSSGEEKAAADPAYPCCTFRGALVALDPASGKTIWKSYTITEESKPTGKNSAGTTIYGPAGASTWSSPTIDAARRRIYLGTGNSYSLLENPATDAVMAFDLDTGKRLWVTQVTQHDIWVICPKPGEGNCPAEIGPDFDFGSSTVLATTPAGKQVILAGQKAGLVYAFDPDNDGKILWKLPLGIGGAFGGIEHGMAADGGTLFAALSDFTPTVAVPKEQLVPHRAGGLTAIDVATGKPLWHTPAPDPVCSWGKDSCSAAQAASVTAMPGIVFSGALDGHLRAYAEDTGAVVWDFDTGHSFDAVNGGKATGGAISGYGQIVAGGMVYLNAGGGYFGPPGNALLVFSVDGK